MTDRQDQNSVVIFIEAIESHVTGMSARDEQLTQTIFDGATDQRMTVQQIDRLLYQLNRLGCERRVDFDQEVSQPFQIGKRLFRINQPDQDLAFGLCGLFPAMRAFR